MNDARNFRRSNKKKPTRERGFTLVELVVVVTIIGVLAALVAPSFFDFMVQQRIRNAAYELIADLTYARSEAVKRNSTVTVTKASTWAGGWTITDAGGTTLRQHPAFSNSVTIAMGSASVGFTRDGRASTVASFTLDDTGGKTSIPPRYICVDLSGRPRSTDTSCT